MQYLVSVIDDKPDSATPGEMTAINAFNDPARGRGPLDLRRQPRVALRGHRHRQQGGDAVFTDGPSLESMEYLGGF